MRYSEGYARAVIQKVDHMQAGSTPTYDSTPCAHALLRAIAATGHSFVTLDASY
jgi:hypothetical protein